MFTTWISNIRNLAILYVGLLMIAACVVGGFLYIAYERNAYTETKAAIETDIHGLVDVYNLSNNVVTLQNAVEQRLKNRHLSSFYLMIDKTGKRIVGNLKAIPKIADSHDSEFTIYEVPYEDVIGDLPENPDSLWLHYDIISKTITLGDGITLLVGRDVDAFQTSQGFIVALAWLTVFLVCLMALIGFLMGSMLLKHMSSIHQTANKVIKTGDLSARIEVEKETGDFKLLADTFNEMLAQIEDLVAGIRQVSDSIAHGLRTPLTRLKHYVEALKKGEDGANIDDIAIEADRIISTFNTLLRIANIEHGNGRSRFGFIDLKTLLNDLWEYYVLLAQEKNITLDIDLPKVIPHITGDKDMLFQAFSNMIENAMRFTPENGHVMIRAQNKGKKVYITLTDTGSGITDHDKSEVFQRFYRAESSRHIPGNGLGLSLVKAVMDLHDADIALEDHEPCGLKITISFSTLNNP